MQKVPFLSNRSCRHAHEIPKLVPCSWAAPKCRSGLLKGPRDGNPANGLFESQLRENDGRDIDVAGGAAGAAVGNGGHDGVSIGPVDTDLLAADWALVGVCVDAVVLF